MIVGQELVDPAVRRSVAPGGTRAGVAHPVDRLLRDQPLLHGGLPPIDMQREAVHAGERAEVQRNHLAALDEERSEPQTEGLENGHPAVVHAVQRGDIDEVG